MEKPEWYNQECKFWCTFNSFMGYFARELLLEYGQDSHQLICLPPACVLVEHAVIAVQFYCCLPRFGKRQAAYKECPDTAHPSRRYNV